MAERMKPHRDVQTKIQIVVSSTIRIYRWHTIYFSFHFSENLEEESSRGYFQVGLAEPGRLTHKPITCQLCIELLTFSSLFHSPEVRPHSDAGQRPNVPDQR
jgi:hypothetical protein